MTHLALASPAPNPMPQAAGERHATAWDRAALTTLGAAGCALSYDALQQMATAIHIRRLLTYLFPLGIDGFIAYGVRALIILRTAPFRSRPYVWTLFGTATTASIWANALHAVRLNQQALGPGLRLGDTAVGVLSTLAPLALAGAVHLHILIARHSPQPESSAVDRTEPDPHPRDCTEASRPHPEPQDEADETKPSLVRETTVSRRHGRPPGAEMNMLLDIARKAIESHGKSSRTVVRDAIRKAGLCPPGRATRQALQHLQTAADHALAPELADLAQRQPKGETCRTLVSDVRAAIPEHAERILTDTGWPALATVLTDAEARGHKPHQLLKEAAAHRELATARQPARVLITRIQHTDATSSPTAAPQQPASAPPPRTRTRS